MSRGETFQVMTLSIHSGGERSLGETKYIIGDSYTVGKVWASTFGINWRTNWALGAFWENAKIDFFAPKNYFWGKKEALVWLYLQSWTWFDVIIILGIKFWWFSFFLDPLLLIQNPSYSHLKISQYLLEFQPHGPRHQPNPARAAEIPTNIDQTSNSCNSGSRWAIEDPKKRKIIRSWCPGWWSHQIRSSSEVIVTHGLYSYLKSSFWV